MLRWTTRSSPGLAPARSRPMLPYTTSSRAAGTFGPDRTVGAAGDEIGWAPVPGSVSPHTRALRRQGQRTLDGAPPSRTAPTACFEPIAAAAAKASSCSSGSVASPIPRLEASSRSRSTRARRPLRRDGDWSHHEIRLKPLNPDPEYRDLVFSSDVEGDLHVVGEFVTVPRPSRAERREGPGRLRPLRPAGPSPRRDRSQAERHPPLRRQAAGAPLCEGARWRRSCFLTNGDVTYFWDYRNDDARSIADFFSRRDLERMVEMQTSRRALATIKIPEHYVREGETRTVRSYQREAMRAPRPCPRAWQAAVSDGAADRHGQDRSHLSLT